jgi:phage/plasmid-like protein (TIGR03299 family)
LISKLIFVFLFTLGHRSCYSYLNAGTTATMEDHRTVMRPVGAYPTMDQTLAGAAGYKAGVWVRFPPDPRGNSARRKDTIMTQSIELAEGGKNVQFTDRTVPWMKLGKVVDTPLTAAEAAKQGGLDFTVSAHEVFFSCEKTMAPKMDENGVVVGGEEVTNVTPDCLRKMTNRRIIVRDDTLEPLSIVSADYPILQYPEAFDFMDEAVQGKGARYVAAGALKGGKQGFMVMRLPEHMQVNVLDGGDPHEMFAVLRTSMDLTKAVEVMMMPLRGLCMNQLTLASFSANVPHKWSVRHTSTMTSKLNDMKSSLGKAEAYAKRYNELATRLSQIKVTDEKARYVLSHVIPKHTKKVDETANMIIDKWHTSPVVGWDGTGWGLVNAVSEWLDWRPAGTAESKFLNAMQGVTHKSINKTARILLQTTSK